MNKLYSLVELQTHSFDDKEIVNVLNKNHLIKLCVIAMFRYVKSTYTDEMIFNFIQQNNWMNKKYWSWAEHDNFIDELAKVFKNIYQYNNTESICMAQHFILMYGFRVRDNKKNENKHFKNLMKHNI